MKCPRLFYARVHVPETRGYIGSENLIGRNVHVLGHVLDASNEYGLDIIRLLNRGEDSVYVSQFVMEKLSRDLVSFLLGYLPAVDLCRLRQVLKQWNTMLGANLKRTRLGNTYLNQNTHLFT